MNCSSSSSPSSWDGFDSILSGLPSAPNTDDKPGFPTYAQYKRMEASYLSDLAPQKRFKALITQAMFDDIWAVLHNPKARTIGSPQFRFWVRKMFTLGRSKRDPSENPDVDDTSLVLHDGRPVAIKEHLYELLCCCHLLAEHGGRDKTCAVIREHFSWIPKDLTARFVKACPTCAEKRNGSRELVAQSLDTPRVKTEDELSSSCSRITKEEVDETPDCSRVVKEEIDDTPVDFTFPVTPRLRAPSVLPVPESPRKKVCYLDEENVYPAELRAREEMFFPSSPFNAEGSSFVSALRSASWSIPSPKHDASKISELPSALAVDPSRTGLFSDANAANNLGGPLKSRFARQVLCDISNRNDHRLWPSVEELSPTRQSQGAAKPIRLQPPMVLESCWCGFSHLGDSGSHVVECFLPTSQLPKLARPLDLRPPFVSEPFCNDVSNLSFPNIHIGPHTVDGGSVVSPMTFSNGPIFQAGIGESSIASPVTLTNMAYTKFSAVNPSHEGSRQRPLLTPTSYANHVEREDQTSLFADWMPLPVCRSQSSISAFPSYASVGMDSLSSFDFDLLCPITLDGDFLDVSFP